MPGMAKSRQSRNGRLEDALATVLQTQASMQQNLSALQQTLTAFLTQMAEMKADSDRRFARIEAILLDHTRILQEHSRILQALPDAVREKNGFKGSGQPG
jgi:hypothetical protein